MRNEFHVFPSPVREVMNGSGEKKQQRHEERRERGKRFKGIKEEVERKTGGAKKELS